MLFVAFPVGFSIVLTFHKWNIISPMEYTGLNNYIRLFNDKTFLKSVSNTLIFLVIHIPLHNIVLEPFEDQLKTEQCKVQHFSR